MSSPARTGPEDLPRLLRTVADELDARGKLDLVMDVVVRDEVEAEGSRFSVTVYYGEDDEER